jgi:hypothetical protein
MRVSVIDVEVRAHFWKTCKSVLRARRDLH